MNTFDITDIKLFEGCSRRQRREVDRLMTGIVVPAGTVLMQQGELGRECFIVCSGTVEIRRDGKAIHESGPGELVGEAALLTDGHVRTASAVATTDCRVLVLSRREFDELGRRLPPVWVRINKIAVRHLAENLERHDAAA